MPTLSDFALDTVGFEAAPGNGCALLPWMDEPMVCDRPALDNDGRCTFGLREATTDDAEEPNLRSGELGTDRARLAPYPYPEPGGLAAGRPKVGCHPASAKVLGILLGCRHCFTAAPGGLDQLHRK